MQPGNVNDFTFVVHLIISTWNIKKTETEQKHIKTKENVKIDKTAFSLHFQFDK